MAKQVAEKLKDNNGFSFKKLWALVMFQFKEKTDNSWAASTKKLIQTIVFSILKFILIAGGTFGAGYVLILLHIIYAQHFVDVYLLFFTVYCVINIINITLGLMKSLYYAEDNKLLVTFPVTSNVLFLSKMMVFFLDELRRSVDMLLPITLGLILCGVTAGKISPICIGYSLIVLVIAVGLMVVLGALFSIPACYIYKATKNWPILELVGFVIFTVAAIVAVAGIITLIPKNIDLINEWAQMRDDAQRAIESFSNYIYPFKYVVRAIVGSPQIKDGITNYVFGIDSVLRSLILLGIFFASFAGIFFLIKPFYFYMMSKSFEFDKTVYDAGKANPVHKKYITFVDKEFKITFRDFEISGSYLIVYILVPLLLFLIDTMFSAINRRLEGYIMTYAFNVLLMTIPYLASNSMVATLYSKEGRAAYIKKTKPVSPLLPLISKLVFNLALSIPSILACAFIFYNYAHNDLVGVIATILLSFTVLLVQYAHIFYSATLDIMNPQNERYATQGSSFTNPNEKVSTIVAFIASALLALITYLLLNDSYYRTGSYNAGFIKIFLIGLVAFGSCLLLFYLKVKAYYFEK